MSPTDTASSLKTCFIAAPVGAPLDVLRASLEARGFRVLVPHDLSVGNDWASETKKQLLHADLVIGVLTAGHESPWVLFELGQASALGRRIVLISPPKAEPISFALHRFIVLRIDPDNEEAIGFALDQLLSAPANQGARKRSARKFKPTTGLGGRADDLIARLEGALMVRDGAALEGLVADALRSSGADVVVNSPNRDVGADFAVWSDVLEPLVGNPLLVEIKTSIRSRDQSMRAFHQLASYLGVSGSRWALLLYGDGPKSQGWPEPPPNILVLSLRSLFESLRTRGFPELVRDLRNRRVHGLS